MINIDKSKKKRFRIPLYVGVIIIFGMGYLSGILSSKEPQYDEINSSLDKLLEINQQIVELQKESLEIEEERLEVVSTSYTPEPVYNFSDDEILLLAQLLCGQAGKDGDGEYDFEWQIAKDDINWFEINKVLEVVMNRTLTPGIYADNVTDVIMQPGAFAVMPRNSNKTPSQEVVDTVRYWCDAFNSPEYVPSIPSDHYWFHGSRGSNITRNHW